MYYKANMFVNWTYLESHPVTFIYPYLLSIDCLAHAVLSAQNTKLHKIFRVCEVQYTNPGG